MKWTLIFFIAFFSVVPFNSRAQSDTSALIFTHADTLRGSNTPERSWWNVLKYEISIYPDYGNRYIRGRNIITYSEISEGRYMQIDLQDPLIIDSVLQDSEQLVFKKEGNVYHVATTRRTAAIRKLSVYYHGNPVIAVKPPWDGGWIFTKDHLGRPWMSVACEGIGASIWYPCKDWLGDEPDSGASLSITVPDTLVAVGNGRLQEEKKNGDGSVTYTWSVVNPINSYDIIPYIGKYVHWHEQYNGEKGPLDCDYWLLDYDLEKAKKHFTLVDSMLKAFEYWFGPYPFYEDGYKLVQAPHLGMEHQSAIAYGNRFLQGYAGRDLSATGWGLKWDFIIVHESGHEWFGNNITCRDIADEWIHEGFTDYSETLYTEYYFGKHAADAYNKGLRKLIENRLPIIGVYGVNHGPEGTDEYYKGSNMLHTIRQVIDNDSLFRSILRGLTRTFYHQTVSTAQIEEYMIKRSGKNLAPIFNEYLRTVQIPELQYTQSGFSIRYRWNRVVPGFDMPLKIDFKGWRWIHPDTHWQQLSLYPEGNSAVEVYPAFYIDVKKLN